jgi:MFS family permease
MSSFFDRENTVAGPGFNRFLVPPAALAVHLCIGQVYAISTFNLPLTKLIGLTQSAPGDWNLKDVGWIFSIAIVFLGSSAAVFGRWVERVGPRKSMFVSALCFAGGFLVSAVGIHWHQLWIIYLGYGVLGGCGLGIGYISPVSTLIKWFPDRPGMATGMAIMGFGGGALIAAPLSVLLMKHFATATSNGVLETFVTMGVIYFMFMMVGVVSVRVPAEGWKPAGWVPSAHQRPLVTQANVSVDVAWRTPQFWLLWVVLCMNVTAGIGVLGQASPMIQEMFPGRITPIAAASFVGLISLFNMVGRFFWASTSDFIGRRNTYMVFFTLVRSYGFDTAVRGGVLYHSFDVRRRLCHHPGIPARCLRHFPSRRHSWPVADGLVGCRRVGSRAGQLHSRLSDRQWRTESASLLGHHVHHVRAAAHRLHLQFRDACGR